MKLGQLVDIVAGIIYGTFFAQFERLSAKSSPFLTHLFPNAPFLYPLKTSETIRFSDIFRG